MSVLTDLRNRGVKDVFFVVCDGLKGLPEVVSNVWPQAIVQTCIIHLIRNTFRLTSRKYWDEIKRDVKPIYTAINAGAARSAFDELAEKWGQRYPAVIRLWDDAWNEFIPFLDYGGCRRIACRWAGVDGNSGDDVVWLSRIVLCCAIIRRSYQLICASGCRPITWCGSCSRLSRSSTRVGWRVRLAAVAARAPPATTLGCCWDCWSMHTARACDHRGRSSGCVSPT